MISPLAVAPLASILLGVLVVLLIDALWRRKASSNLVGYLGLGFLGLAGFFAIRAWNLDLSYFSSALILDKLGIYLSLVLFVAVAFVILMSFRYLAYLRFPRGEFLALLLLALCGMTAMVTTSSLLVIFLGLEVLSVSSYALAGMPFRDERSSEAAVKYFLLGSLASAFLVFALALLYGSCRSLDLPIVVAALKDAPGPLAILGLSLTFVAFAFKVSLVPFHMWTPDVYEGASTPVAGFFSVGPKVVGFAVLLRMFLGLEDIRSLSAPLFWALAAVAVLTMLWANLAALRQTNVKRILAYSSIGHAGYAFVALLSRDSASLVFYVTAYAFMNLGAFAALTAMTKQDKEFVDLEDFAGIGFRYPWIGATFTLFLLSLAGFPPTAGFLAKFYVFISAVRQDLAFLALVGVLATLISVYFYLRIVVTMYMREPVHDVSIPQENPTLFLVLFLCLYGVLQLGLNPGNVLALIRRAVAAL